jgi:hypothetical protein
VFDDAVQGASGGAPVIATVPLAAPELTFTEVGFNEKEGVAPACSTGNVKPAIVSDPLRGFTELFAVAEYPTLPLPDPELPEAIDSQVELLAAVQGASVRLHMTAAEPVAAPAPGVADKGLRVNTATPPCWVTVNVWPAAVIVPDR